MSPFAPTPPTMVRSDAFAGPRVDWPRIAIWVGALALCLAFWTAVATTAASLL